MNRLSYEAKYWDFSIARRMTQAEREDWLDQQPEWHELLRHETGLESSAFKGVKRENPKVLLQS